MRSEFLVACGGIGGGGDASSRGGRRSQVESRGRGGLRRGRGGLRRGGGGGAVDRRWRLAEARRRRPAAASGEGKEDAGGRASRGRGRRWRRTEGKGLKDSPAGWNFSLNR